jgi:hypothetical protein
MSEIKRNLRYLQLHPRYLRNIVAELNNIIPLPSISRNALNK